MQIGRKLFYDNVTGKIIVDTGEWDNAVRNKTVEEEIATYPALSQRDPSSFDVLELEYGEYRQDFKEMNGYRVNPTTQGLEFSYPDPNDPEAPIEYVQPLSERIDELEIEIAESNTELFEMMLLMSGGM